MGWSDVRPPKKPPLGEWEAYSSGEQYRGWLLRCGALFISHIRLSNCRYYVWFNGEALGPRDTLDEAQGLAERAIVERVREMLPGYRVIHARVMRRDGVREEETGSGAPPFRVVPGGADRS